MSGNVCQCNVVMICWCQKIPNAQIMLLMPSMEENEQKGVVTLSTTIGSNTWIQYQNWKHQLSKESSHQKPAKIVTKTPNVNAPKCELHDLDCVFTGKRHTAAVEATWPRWRTEPFENSPTIKLAHKYLRPKCHHNIDFRNSLK